MSNLNNIAIIMQENIVTVRCIFENDEEARTYTFLCNGDLANTLGRGDAVVVKDVGGESYKVVYVDEVDTECDIDLSASYKYKWIVSIIKEEDQLAVETAENKIQETIAYLKKKR